MALRAEIVKLLLSCPCGESCGKKVSSTFGFLLLPEGGGASVSFVALNTEHRSPTLLLKCGTLCPAGKVIMAHP